MGYPVEGHEDDMATAFIRERPGVNAMFVSMLGPGPSLEEVRTSSIADFEDRKQHRSDVQQPLQDIPNAPMPYRSVLGVLPKLAASPLKL